MWILCLKKMKIFVTRCNLLKMKNKKHLTNLEKETFDDIIGDIRS